MSTQLAIASTVLWLQKSHKFAPHFSDIFSGWFFDFNCDNSESSFGHFDPQVQQFAAIEL